VIGEKNTPIIRKLIDLRTSKAICLPKSWLENAEQEAGKKIIGIALEVDRVITLQPVFEKKREVVDLGLKKQEVG
jgi:hypothetical protein